MEGGGRGCFLDAVCDVDQGEQAGAGEAVDGLPDSPFAGLVETVERLVEDEQGRILDESAGQQEQPLFACRHGAERAVGKVADVQIVHPPRRQVELLLCELFILPHGVV